MARRFHKRFDDNLRLLRDVVRMKLLKFPNDFRGAARGHVGVLVDRLGDFKTRVVGHVVLKNVQNELFFNRLPHRVDMERAKRTVVALFAEHLEGRVFRGRGKGEERKVFVLAVREHFPNEFVFRVDFLLRFSFDFRVFFERVFGIGERGFELHRGSARLRRMRFVDDNRVIAPFGGVDLIVNDGEFLQRRYNNANARVERVAQMPAGLVLADRFDGAERMVETGNRLLQLRVQNGSVGDDDHARKDRSVVFVVKRGESIRRPRDRVRLARPRRMLYEIIMPRAAFGDVRDKLSNDVELMIARKDQPLAFDELFVAVARSFLFDLNLKAEKLLENIQHAVFLKDFFPEIRGRVPVGIGRIPLASVATRPRAPLIERKEKRVFARKFRRHADFRMIDGEEP